MIGKLTGTISAFDEKGVLIETGGIGYRVHVMTELLRELPLGKDISLWTHEYIREDARELYGFREKEYLDFFILLISVSGVGPKTALSILGIAPPTTLKQAIATQNTSYLTKVSGIGRKNAEKIILELRDKVGDVIEEGAGTSFEEDTDVVLALKSLGYSTKEAREAVQKIPENLTGTSERLREALKHLAK